MKNLSWWKIASIVLILYSLIAGMLIPVPRLPILNETARNLYYHVPMWFAMITILGASFIQSIRYLRNFNPLNDVYASALASVGMVMGILGLLTGMLWAKYTWGYAWSNDPKQMVSAVSLLIYSAYFVLRGTVEDPDKCAKISAVYNIFAYFMLIPLLFVVPRLTASLHPGNGGNPGFNAYDLDNFMRLVFYPACIGWILFGFWLAQIVFRIKKLENHEII